MGISLAGIRQPDFDNNGGIHNIDTFHHKIHEGVTFHTNSQATSIADEGTLQCLLTTGAKVAHLTFEAKTGGKSYVCVYETPRDVNATSGSAVTVYNMKRTSSTTPTVTFRQFVTVVNPGATAIVNKELIPGGASQQTRIGGSATKDEEWILKRNTQYLVGMQNVFGGAVDMSIQADWYEVEV